MFAHRRAPSGPTCSNHPSTRIPTACDLQVTPSLSGILLPGLDYYRDVISNATHASRASNQQADQVKSFEWVHCYGTTKPNRVKPINLPPSLMRGRQPRIPNLQYMSSNAFEGPERLLLHFGNQILPWVNALDVDLSPLHKAIAGALQVERNEKTSAIDVAISIFIFVDTLVLRKNPLEWAGAPWVASQLTEVAARQISFHLAAERPPRLNSEVLYFYHLQQLRDEIMATEQYHRQRLGPTAERELRMRERYREAKDAAPGCTQVRWEDIVQRMNLTIPTAQQERDCNSQGKASKRIAESGRSTQTLQEDKQMANDRRLILGESSSVWPSAGKTLITRFSEEHGKNTRAASYIGEWEDDESVINPNPVIVDDDLSRNAPALGILTKRGGSAALRRQSTKRERQEVFALSSVRQAKQLEVSTRRIPLTKVY